MALSGLYTSPHTSTKLSPNIYTKQVVTSFRDWRRGRERGGGRAKGEGSESVGSTISGCFQANVWDAPDAYNVNRQGSEVALGETAIAKDSWLLVRHC